MSRKLIKFECTNCYYSFYETEESPKKLIADENGKVIMAYGITKTNNYEVGCGVCGGGIIHEKGYLRIKY